MVFNQEKPAIGFLIGAPVLNIRPHHLIGLWQFRALRIAVCCAERIIDQLELELLAFAAVGILCVEKFVAVLGRQEKARAGVLSQGSEEADQVVIHPGQAAGVVDRVFQDDFVLATASARVTAGPVNRDGIVHAAERVIGMKFDGEADARGNIPAAFARLQMDPHVVENLLFVVHDCRAHPAIAHDVGPRVQERRVGPRHDQPNVVEVARNRLAIIDLVESARIATSRRERGLRPQQVGCFDVELDHRRRGKSGNCRLEPAVGGRRHRSIAPGCGVGGPPQQAGGHAVRIVHGDRDGHGLVGCRDNRTMLELAESGADVGFEAGIARAGRPSQVWNLERCDAGQAVEVEPRVNLVRAGQPFGAKRDFVFASVHDCRAIGQRRFGVVVHVFGGADGNQVQDMVGGIVRVNHDFAAMIADDSPGGRAVFKQTVLEEFARRGVR